MLFFRNNFFVNSNKTNKLQDSTFLNKCYIKQQKQYNNNKNDLKIITNLPIKQENNNLISSKNDSQQTNLNIRSALPTTIQKPQLIQNNNHINKPTQVPIFASSNSSKITIEITENKNLKINSISCSNSNLTPIVIGDKKEEMLLKEKQEQQQFNNKKQQNEEEKEKFLLKLQQQKKLKKQQQTTTKLKQQRFKSQILVPSKINSFVNNSTQNIITNNKPATSYSIVNESKNNEKEHQTFGNNNEEKLLSLKKTVSSFFFYESKFGAKKLKIFF